MDKETLTTRKTFSTGHYIENTELKDIVKMSFTLEPIETMHPAFVENNIPYQYFYHFVDINSKLDSLLLYYILHLSNCGKYYSSYYSLIKDAMISGTQDWILEELKECELKPNTLQRLQIFIDFYEAFNNEEQEKFQTMLEQFNRKSYSECDWTGSHLYELRIEICGEEFDGIEFGFETRVFEKDKVRTKHSLYFNLSKIEPKFGKSLID